MPSSLDHVSSLESLIDRVFSPDLLNRIPSRIPDLLASRVLLAIKNDTVTEINSIILIQMVTGPPLINISHRKEQFRGAIGPTHPPYLVLSTNKIAEKFRSVYVHSPIL